MSDNTAAGRVQRWLDFDESNRSVVQDRLGVSYEGFPLLRSDLRVLVLSAAPVGGQEKPGECVGCWDEFVAPGCPVHAAAPVGGQRSPVAETPPAEAEPSDALAADLLMLLDDEDDLKNVVDLLVKHGYLTRSASPGQQ